MSEIISLVMYMYIRDTQAVHAHYVRMHACIHLHTPTVTVVTSVDPCYMYTVCT